MSEPPTTPPQDLAPGADEQQALSRLETTIQTLETAHARLAVDRRRIEPDPMYTGVERRKFHRDRRLDETLKQLKHAANQIRSVLRPLSRKTLQARLAAGSRTADLLARIRAKKP